MIINGTARFSKLDEAVSIWRSKARAFDESPPGEAAIAALELEAAERRYMLILRSTKERSLKNKEETNVTIQHP